MNVLDRDRLSEVSLADPKLMRTLLHALVDDTGAAIESIRNAAATGNRDEVSRLVHSSKGACASVGATAAAAILRGIEDDCRAGDWDRCTRSLIALADQVTQLDRIAAEM